MLLESTVGEGKRKKEKKKEGKEKDRMGRMSRKEKEGSKIGQKETALRKLSPDFTGNLKMA